MGGYQSLSPFPFSPTNKCYSYDPVTNTWSPIQDIPVIMGSASSVVLNGEIHLLGGENNITLNSHRIYNPITNSWYSAQPLINARASSTASVIQGRIYVAGGYVLSGGVVSLDSAEVYDPNTNSWSAISSMPFTKLGISSAVFQYKMYVFGNENNTNILEYDPILNTWTQQIAMPENVNFAAAIELNNLIYLIGGGQINLVSDSINAVNCLNPALLSVNSFDFDSFEISLHPNPTNDFINIQISSKEYYNDLKIELYSVLGEKIQILNAAEILIGNNTLSYNISTIKTGLYFLKLSFKNNFTTKSFIKK